ncbi:hypothetical protein RA11412_1010 [Rothia aeria]|uniref:Uncharacterized protein n=1 Tax=Rothia aeria TaxID=172042 RepID=A0A2Z5R322_9MICC|nr:hypothetical protein RA11412_1010 [Rothia aeria]
MLRGRGLLSWLGRVLHTLKGTASSGGVFAGRVSYMPLWRCAKLLLCEL